MARLKSSRPTTAVVVIAHDPTPQLGTLLLAAGATCLAQSVAVVDILSAVHQSAQGERVFVGIDGRRPRGHGGTQTLTRREVEVFRHLSNGARQSVIAFEMGISVETVRSHAKSIYRKLGVQNGQQLIGRELSGSSDRGMA
ncbi:MAG TPA: LuxR C-terminal-related transcriptional regulator [Solirubrobacteraceae bacterium]|nr:LuxR C-terminal-related transcriptional regulator [Solirubrobacteraceae bacterium]